MSSILAIHSSLSRENAISSKLVDQTVASLAQGEPGSRVVTRDLAATPIPHLDGAAISGIRGDAITEDQIAARALSTELVDELKAADILVIGAPMYNFGIASSLKAWFDYVLHPGVTFKYGEGGPKGLLTGKRAIVILSRGGFFSDGPAKAMDSQEPHLRTLLWFMGITDVTFIRAERLAMGPQAMETAVAAATKDIEETVETMKAAA
ncbi:FMN-dependent NADH-azoreductase [Rhodoblastus acidophilus]|uniref:FMN dependent NADH:quinone oxidoreductase n=1 Tax=Candidatus Rhodoblastus alkanivorans TaxID=2954117 RepID=A0ABS9Z5R7_9HYPH|nr:FMN-dependent NADH-azoreductase [Candidatus Rhodoblastus alkanivorans]MCI4679250.1 FMN-dependent NADH-azoreductase [Candidatus Rhodoblastus alkanivorans]MCI4682426.1 FMN-dependent NADH-azoreductase [Candidatus Rhodoblastus alkanivorans]MDI4639732.1 FMN-dependent NADH-azoreductase [Rhodoblastus acidophilus]